METEPNESVTPLLKYRQEYEDRIDGNSLGMVNYTEGGLTIRAYIATKALQGIMSSTALDVLRLNDRKKAEYAVIMADYLIEEINKKK